MVENLPCFQLFVKTISVNPWLSKLGQGGAIPITLEDARALAARAHPNHLLIVSSWGFAPLPPSCISNSDGYISFVDNRQGFGTVAKMQQRVAA